MCDGRGCSLYRAGDQESASLLFEVKEGPYTALGEDDLLDISCISGK